MLGANTVFGFTFYTLLANIFANEFFFITMNKVLLTSTTRS